ncbi:hypothetical protein SGPA1_10542 [Streptomyces misionensis JCM 4497]
MQMQGGGGSRRGASTTDDNAADVRARLRDPGKIRKKGPRRPVHRPLRHRPSDIRSPR